MDICNKMHDQIVYEGRVCPLCDAKWELDDAIAGLNKDIETLTIQLNDTRAELNERDRSS